MSYGHRVKQLQSCHFERSRNKDKFKDRTSLNYIQAHMLEERKSSNSIEMLLSFLTYWFNV